MEIETKERLSLYMVFNVLIKYGKNISNIIKKTYHIIIPIMPGHNPKKQEKFFSFLQTSRELEDYYISRYGKSVYAIYGMSMGGVLTATLWQNGQLEIEKVIFDGFSACIC